MILIAKQGGFKSDDLQNVKAILSKVKNAPSKNEIDKWQPETTKVLDKKIWKKDPSHATKLDSILLSENYKFDAGVTRHSSNLLVIVCEESHRSVIKAPPSAVQFENAKCLHE